jgi:hypothetical protein
MEFVSMMEIGERAYLDWRCIEGQVRDHRVSDAPDNTASPMRITLHCLPRNDPGDRDVIKID